MKHGFCVLIYGLSGSGKTTLGLALARALEEQKGIKPVRLDGNDLRSLVSPGLDFSRASRLEHARRTAGIASILENQGHIVIITVMAPFDDMRDYFREFLKNLVEVWLECPVHVCRRRDPQGVYALAAAGEVTFLPGHDIEFEVPSRHDLRLRSDQMSLEEEVNEILTHIQNAGKLKAHPF